MRKAVENCSTLPMDKDETTGFNRHNLMDLAQQTELICRTREYVRETANNRDGSHDWWHVERVWQNALQIHAVEGGDRRTIELAALLHDIADYKYHHGDETAGPRRARKWLLSCGAPDALAEEVSHIISFLNFGGPKGSERRESLEHAIVQDADRLDALGALGIGRAFSFGGHLGRPMYAPDIRPNLEMDKQQYRASKSPTLNHFFEKLFHLRERMLTPTGRRLAEDRHQCMVEFVREFLLELGETEGEHRRELLELLDRFSAPSPEREA
jgi:uncharacterized protein